MHSAGIRSGAAPCSPLALICLIAAMLSPACRQAEEIPGGRSDERRPNIVYIMADDLGYADLSGYGRADYATPALDALPLVRPQRHDRAVAKLLLNLLQRCL